MGCLYVSWSQNWISSHLQNLRSSQIIFNWIGHQDVRRLLHRRERGRLHLLRGLSRHGLGFVCWIVHFGWMSTVTTSLHKITLTTQPDFSDVPSDSQCKPCNNAHGQSRHCISGLTRTSTKRVGIPYMTSTQKGLDAIRLYGFLQIAGRRGKKPERYERT